MGERVGGIPGGAPGGPSLRERVAAIDGWYHAIDLGDGVRTPGPFDMVAHLAAYSLPEDLTGRRVLDVGCADGFFSVEFERRGADVVAVDVPSWLAKDFTPSYRRGYLARYDPAVRLAIDDQLRAPFELVVGTLGRGRILRRELSIYEIGPELGSFDLVFCASVLMHLRDPLLALQRLRTVCRDLLIVSVSTPADHADDPVARFAGEPDQCNFWQMTPACLRRMLACSDFEPVDAGASFVLTDVSTPRVQQLLAEQKDAIDPSTIPGSGAFRDPHYVCHARGI